MWLLRFFLAICVILWHADFFWIDFIGWSLAVEIFFIISGFYMALILSEKYKGSASYEAFIKNRFLRIFPIYFVVFFIGLLFSFLWWIFIWNWGFLNNYFLYGGNLTPSSWIILLFSNIFLFWQDWIRLFSFSPEVWDFSLFWYHIVQNISTSVFQFFPQSWTLAMELCFYIIAPYVVRKNIIFLLYILIACIIFRWVAFFLFSDINFTYFFPYQCIFFFAGIFSYKLYALGYIRSWSQKYWKIGIFSLLFFLCCYDFFWYHIIINWVIYIHVVLFTPYLFELTKQSAIDMKIWNLSYPLYIVHLFVLYLLLTLNQKMFFFEMYIVTIFTLLISIFFALLLVKYVDTPIQLLRTKNFKKLTHLSWK